MPSVEEFAVLGIVALVLAMAWIAYQIRKLHEDLQPVIDSTIVQTLSRA